MQVIMRLILKPLRLLQMTHKQLLGIRFSISTMGTLTRMDVGLTGLVLRKTKKHPWEFSLRRMVRLHLSLLEKWQSSSSKTVEQTRQQKWYWKDMLVLLIQNQAPFLVMKKMRIIHLTRQKTGKKFHIRHLEKSWLVSQLNLPLIRFRQQPFEHV